jgi:glutamate dehydrogenase
VDLGGVLANYFLTPMRQRFADRMGGTDCAATSPTVPVNEAINWGGISFVFRVVEETPPRRRT